MDEVSNGYIAESVEVAQKSALNQSDNFFIINIFTAKDRKRKRHRKYDLYVGSTCTSRRPRSDHQSNIK